MENLSSSVTHEALARASYLYFIQYAFGLKPYRHIQQMAQLLDGPERFCAIVIPPGFGKSTLVSQTWPSWLMGNHPNRSILLISNTDKQAKLFMKANQETIEHLDAYKRVFPDVAAAPERGWSSDGLFLKWRKDPESGVALPDWHTKPATDKDPALSAFGVGGPVIGRRADTIIIDDPYSQDNARSAVQREAFLDWFRQTLLSRLKPVAWAKVVLVVTRWHPEDVIAWCMEQNKAEDEEKRLATEEMQMLSQQAEASLAAVAPPAPDTPPDV